jgi:aldehyde:ferredoxin oxidoreductase
MRCTWIRKQGCPVGCIHVGLLREKFAEQNEFQYRQVSYDHEPVFAAGSMLGVTNAGGVLTLLEEMERQGLDVMSAGVALEERRRVQLTCMVSCLFARNIYSEERLQECLSSLGLSRLAQSVVARSKDVQAKRWQLKYMTGYNPKDISIPKRFEEVTTWKGAIDKVFMDSVAADYQNAVRKLAESGQSVQSS